MTKLTKKQINRIAAAAFAAVMATSMTIPAFASGNVLASEAPNGLYSSTAGNSNLYTDYQNNQVGSSEGSTSFRIPEAESTFILFCTPIKYILHCCSQNICNLTSRFVHKVKSN